MRKIGIVGAMDIEVDELVGRLSATKVEGIKGFSVYRAERDGLPIYLCRSGIGKASSAASTRMLIDRFEIDCVINTGVAGGLDRSLRANDLVVSSHTTYHDFTEGILERNFPYTSKFAADDRLVKIAEEACSDLSYGSRVITAPIATGDVFLESSEEGDRIATRTGAACVDMESAAIGHVAYISEVPFVAIRAISDSADESAGGDFDANVGSAASRAAEIVLRVIDMIAGEKSGNKTI